MLRLSSTIWLFSLFVLINSYCDRRTPRKEGYLREPCVPGFYEGSCLIVLGKMKLEQAYEKCRYDYGGRLATAPSKEAFKVWARTIHFSTKKNIDENSRFWVGYGKYGFKNVIPGEEDPTYDVKRWKRVFNTNKFVKIDDWESDKDIGFIDDTRCSGWTPIFNPYNHKFIVGIWNQEYHGLCETVRWAKLQCEPGWYLIKPLRMCVNVYNLPFFFISAHMWCNTLHSFIATPQNPEELSYLRNIINPLKINRKVIPNIYGFWIGLKSEGTTTFSMDGTKPIFFVEDAPATDKACIGIYEKLTDDSQGAAIQCAALLPFMCQKFADQSSPNNIH